jgi:hypothetical protein
MTTGQKVGIGIGAVAIIGVGAYFLLKPSETDGTGAGTGGTGAGTGGAGGGGVMCKDGTRGNRTAQPCLGHGGIAQQQSPMQQIMEALGLGKPKGKPQGQGQGGGPKGGGGSGSGGGPSGGSGGGP